MLSGPFLFELCTPLSCRVRPARPVQGCDDGGCTTVPRKGAACIRLCRVKQACREHPQAAGSMSSGWACAIAASRASCPRVRPVPVVCYPVPWAPGPRTAAMHGAEAEAGRAVVARRHTSLEAAQADVSICIDAIVTAIRSIVRAVAAMGRSLLMRQQSSRGETVVSIDRPANPDLP